MILNKMIDLISVKMIFSCLSQNLLMSSVSDKMLTAFYLFKDLLNDSFTDYNSDTETTTDLKRQLQ